MIKSYFFKKMVSYVLIVMLLTACGTTPAKQENDLPTAVLRAQSWLAEQLNVSIEEIQVVAMEEMEWTDSCFGLGGAAEMCAAEITPGWRAEFEVNGQQYEVRFDTTGTLARSPQI